ncbi:unnamed protein product, partial [Laminaria digitata]
MRFVDPLDVRCPGCAAAMAISVADLLSLSPRCSSCAASLERVGREMREAVDDWAYFSGMAAIVLQAEQELDCAVPDEALAAAETVGDLHAVLVGLLPQRAG